MSLPPALLAVLATFRSAFTAPTWRTVVVLIVGAVLAPGRRTVTAALRQTGHQAIRPSGRSPLERLPSRAHPCTRVCATGESPARAAAGPDRSGIRRGPHAGHR